MTSISEYALGTRHSALKPSALKIRLWRRVSSVEKIQDSSSQISILAELRYLKLNRRSLVSRDDSPSVLSHRSSLSKEGAGTIQREELKGSEQVLAKIVEDTDFIYQMFEAFLLSSGKDPLVTRSKNIQANSGALEAFCKHEIPDFAETERAEALLNLFATLNKNHAVDLYVTVSKNYKTEKSTGKKAVKTVTKSFQTDVSQSTEEHSPRERSSRQAPKTLKSLPLYIIKRHTRKDHYTLQLH
ncbi:hypothetical protein QQZ08_000990 [Neonectria magnoliae]|uniref:RGS domain-containing protein n=1 Tax=Neonectria magnoliae TaxID=2732573 RepID=A0ABR1IHF0_9HYPO